MDIQKIPLTDADEEPFESFFERLEKSINECREAVLKCIRDGKPMPKTYFRSRRKDFTKVYECEDYKCDAHPQGCLFCKHSTDVWWDYTNGPHMICELQKDGDPDMPTLGFIGECGHFSAK